MVTVKFPCIWLSELMVTVTFPCIWLAKLMASGNISFYLIGWTDGQWQPFFLSDCLSWWPKATFLIIWLSELMANGNLSFYLIVWADGHCNISLYLIVWADGHCSISFYLIFSGDGQWQKVLVSDWRRRWPTATFPFLWGSHCDCSFNMICC